MGRFQRYGACLTLAVRDAEKRTPALSGSGSEDGIAATLVNLYLNSYLVGTDGYGLRILRCADSVGILFSS